MEQYPAEMPMMPIDCFDGTITRASDEMLGYVSTISEEQNGFTDSVSCSLLNALLNRWTVSESNAGCSDLWESHIAGCLEYGIFR